jgi:hypothetical protein
LFKTTFKKRRQNCICKRCFNLIIKNTFSRRFVIIVESTNLK